MALSRASYDTDVYVNDATMPKMVDKDDWNWGDKGSFMAGAREFSPGKSRVLKLALGNIVLQH
ncbi:hypothetical protein PG997_005634 [Apiospora hydei]|uniref:Uncharacterized protein n=1 Tax=Apiospora hydei TaxID=1337664 RepID=A0ABR1WQS3_9PEZI